MLKGGRPFLPGMQPRDLSAHDTYRAGRGIEEVARERGLDPDDLVKLASNENPFGPSPAAVAAIREHAERAGSYPRTSHVDLTAALAECWDVSDEQVWLANGGDGALDYLARAFLDPGDTVLTPRPGFAYYPMSARFHHGTVQAYYLQKEDDFTITSQTILDAYTDERIVYITTPHNPTGSWCSVDVIETIADETDEETLLVVDEAYGEFVDETSAVSLLEGRDDVAVLRTFSKAYGLAGLRLGYAIVPEDWSDAYAKVNTPFAASELACRAGITALKDDEHVTRTVETVRRAREYLTRELSVPTYQSGGNFVLAEVGDATAVADELEARGVIVRDCSSFGLEACIRITCGTDEDTERAVETINEIVAQREIPRR